jgi:hypothetical protein
MNYPLIPLWSALASWSSFNVMVSAFLSMVFGVSGFLLLFGNILLKYHKVIARWGLVFLAVALIISIVGIVYLVAVPLAALALYVLIYWVLWRILIKNVIAAIRSESTVKSSEPDERENPQ